MWLGSDGAGTIARRGVGMLCNSAKAPTAFFRVAASLIPRADFTQKYATKRRLTTPAHVPDKISQPWQAGVLMVDAGNRPCTGSTGLLVLKDGESVMIIRSASGGHRPPGRAKLAKNGVGRASIRSRLGTKNGRDAGEENWAPIVVAVRVTRDDVPTMVRHFSAPNGVDAALVTAWRAGCGKGTGGPWRRRWSEIAYPKRRRSLNPSGRQGVDVQSYDGTPDPILIDEINRLIDAGPHSTCTSVRRFRFLGPGRRLPTRAPGGPIISASWPCSQVSS